MDITISLEIKRYFKENHSFIVDKNVLHGLLAKPITEVHIRYL